jgi:hypothetical protein
VIRGDFVCQIVTYDFYVILNLGSRKQITYSFHLLFFPHFSLKILNIPMGMSAFFAFDAIASSKPSKEKIAM